MSKFARRFLILGLSLLIVVPSANAISVTFTDNVNYWAGWGNGSSDDSKDSIGIPNILGGVANIGSAGNLMSLSFEIAGSSSGLWSLISPGDLFLATGTTHPINVWDRVVDLTSWSVSGASNIDPIPALPPDKYNMYTTNLPLNIASGYTSGYIFSGADNADGWSGYNIRDNHPVAADPSILSGSAELVNFSPSWQTPQTANTTYTFDFSGFGGVMLGDEFAIGWGMNCANDMVYAELNNPVPEPATMLLLGTGLIGLAGVGRKKFRKKA